MKQILLNENRKMYVPIITLGIIFKTNIGNIICITILKQKRFCVISLLTKKKTRILYYHTYIYIYSVEFCII